MNPALWGAVTAAAWGSADFIARFTGRAMGVTAALFGMLAISGLALTVMVVDELPLLAWDAAGAALVLVAGVGITFATLLLYWGLARGPVTVVAPITGSYPAFAMIVALFLGSRPGAGQWAAMAVVMAGVVVVARFSAEDGAGNGKRYGHEHVRRSVWIALGASVGFAFAIMAAQGAAAVYGELPTLWMVRWIGLFCLLPVFARNRGMPRPTTRWLPLLVLLALQGLLDSGAYVALFLPAGQDGAEIAVVVASGFSAVTVLLARIVLREAMTWPQWAGIAAIVGGVAALSYYS